VTVGQVPNLVLHSYAYEQDTIQSYIVPDMVSATLFCYCVTLANIYMLCIFAYSVCHIQYVNVTMPLLCICSCTYIHHTHGYHRYIYVPYLYCLFHSI